MTIQEIEIANCTRDEKALSKLKRDSLIAEVKRHHRVGNFDNRSDFPKWELIAMILRARYGVKVLKQVPGWS